MKITVGLGSIDEYIPYAEAGADALFCGYMPRDWAEKYGLFMPINRREVIYYNVQIGSRSELHILRDMIEQYHIPVTIALNSLYYLPEQYPILAELIRQCAEDGFSSFIIADMALLVYLKQNGISDHIQIHISGEFSEINCRVIELCRKMDAKRIIFHRKVSLQDMQRCIKWDSKQHPMYPMEYEAFVLNEMCHFHGAFCNSLHCDELTHMCLVPYQLGGLSKAIGLPEITDEMPEVCEADLLGDSGCGLCALWKMKQMGITHVKLVSRGNYIEKTLRDIQGLKQAIRLAEQAETEQEYLINMKSSLFPKGCSRNCYYYGQ